MLKFLCYFLFCKHYFSRYAQDLYEKRKVSGFVPQTGGSGRPKNIWIRIPNTRSDFWCMLTGTQKYRIFLALCSGTGNSIKEWKYRVFCYRVRYSFVVPVQQNYLVEFRQGLIVRQRFYSLLGSIPYLLLLLKQNFLHFLQAWRVAGEINKYSTYIIFLFKPRHLKSLGLRCRS